MSWALFVVALVAFAMMMRLYSDPPKWVAKFVGLATVPLAIIAGWSLAASPPGSFLADAVGSGAGFLGGIGNADVSGTLIVGGVALVLSVGVVWTLLRLQAPVAVLFTIVALPILVANVVGGIGEPVRDVYSSIGDEGAAQLTEWMGG